MDTNQNTTVVILEHGNVFFYLDLVHHIETKYKLKRNVDFSWSIVPSWSSETGKKYIKFEFKDAQWASWFALKWG